MEENKLSKYELKRLEKIERNKKVLAELGIKDMKPLVNTLESTPPKKRYSKRRRYDSSPPPPSRRSRRLQKIDAEITVNEETPKDLVVEPKGPIIPSQKEDLNDEQQIVYEKLRKWRLETSRKLEIRETYKICQNKTLCELVAFIPSNTEELLDIWGMGPTRVEQYGTEIIELLAKHGQNLVKLELNDTEEV